MGTPLIDEALKGFDIHEKVIKCEPFGSGHINHTYLAEYETEDGIKRYVYQRMSKALTKQCDLLMENIVLISEHIRNKVIEKGGDPSRECQNFLKTPEGKYYFVDSEKEFWRAYNFIEDATSFDSVEKPEDFYESGFAFGNFQRLLGDFDASKLHETIPGFHDTKKRFDHFEEVLKADAFDRAKYVKKEIEFIYEHRNLVNKLGDMLKAGELPLRVTHNDTKLNNILIDNATGRAICVIDLDTVMPGLSVHDFGDSIRFGANTALEDEKDLSKVSLDLDLYKLYAKAFLEGCGGVLTRKEVEMLPMGALVITFECGMRFFTDYLEGDVYFHIARDGHNLDRARTQFELIKDMERKWDEMQIISA